MFGTIHFIPAPGRPKTRTLAQYIAGKIHPINTLRVLRHLVQEMKVTEEDKNRRDKHWTE